MHTYNISNEHQYDVIIVPQIEEEPWMTVGGASRYSSINFRIGEQKHLLVSLVNKLVVKLYDVLVTARHKPTITNQWKKTDTTYHNSRRGCRRALLLLRRFLKNTVNKQDRTDKTTKRSKYLVFEPKFASLNETVYLFKWDLSDLSEWDLKPFKMFKWVRFEVRCCLPIT